MLQAARRKILIVDHSKFSRRALHAIAPISEFDIVIVDSNIDPADLRRLRQSNVDVRIAQVSQVDADETSKARSECLSNYQMSVDVQSCRNSINGVQLK